MPREKYECHFVIHPSCHIVSRYTKPCLYWIILSGIVIFTDWIISYKPQAIGDNRGVSVGASTGSFLLASRAAISRGNGGVSNQRLFHQRVGQKLQGLALFGLIISVDGSGGFISCANIIRNIGFTDRLGTIDFTRRRFSYRAHPRGDVDLREG